MAYFQSWLQYNRAHRRPATRGVHYAGSLLALMALAIGIAAMDWRWLVAAPLVGYGLAWAAHMGLERNRPATFGHPLWSLVSDYRMLSLWLSAGLASHPMRADDGRL